MGAAIEAMGVGKLFGDPDRAVGLRDLSVHVQPGQVLAVLGHNGAGKTTAVRGLSTLLRFDRGYARVAGFDVRTQAHQVRERIALVSQAAAVDDQLTAVQNLSLFGRLRGLDRRAATARARALTEQFGLTDAVDRRVHTFSGGMRRRLDLAAGVIVRPQVLFVDEPTTGLDPAGRRDLWRTLRTLVAEGTTVLLTTQYLEEADALADHILLLAHGQVIAQGTAEELKARLGHNVLQVRFTNSGEALRALPLLAAVDPGAELDDAATATLVAVGDQVLLRCVQSMADAGIWPLEVSLRKPTLDEVFLSLTQNQPAPEENSK